MNDKLDIRRYLSLLHLLVIGSMLGGVVEPLVVGPAKAAAAPAMSGLHVVGNQILNDSGRVVHLLGVNRGAANACIQGWGIFSGPTDETTVQAMATWNIQAVRIPLNEDCWLGNNGAPAAYSGATYQQAIGSYIALLNKYNMAAIVDLHWNAPGSLQAQNQQPMPDADHAPAFWTSVADTFKGNTSVVFDLYNEPYPDNNQDTSAAWTCLRDGCEQSFYVDANGNTVSYTWQAAGMNQLISAVRSTGATNLIMTAGVGWAGLMTRWLEYVPNDPQNNLAASTHIYPNTWCSTTSCWNSALGPITEQYPLVAGEIGETDCGHTFIDGLMGWLDQHGDSYLAWHWWPLSDVPCSAYALITDYTSGGATDYGIGLKDHLAAVAAARQSTAVAPNPPPAVAEPAATSLNPTPTLHLASPSGVACTVVGSVSVAPAVDGVVGTPDGNVSITIPRGSVGEWTTVTLAVLQSPDGSTPTGVTLQAGGMDFRLAGLTTSSKTINFLQGPVLISARLGPTDITILNSGSGALEPAGGAANEPNGRAMAKVAALPLAGSVCP